MLRQVASCWVLGCTSYSHCEQGFLNVVRHYHRFGSRLLSVPGFLHKVAAASIDQQNVGALREGLNDLAAPLRIVRKRTHLANQYCAIVWHTKLHRRRRDESKDGVKGKEATRASRAQLGVLRHVGWSKQARVEPPGENTYVAYGAGKRCCEALALHPYGALFHNEVCCSRKAQAEAKACQPQQRSGASRNHHATSHGQNFVLKRLEASFQAEKLTSRQG